MDVIDELIEGLAGGGGIRGLSKAIGVSRGTIYRWRAAGYIPPDTQYEIVARVSEISGIPVERLTGVA